jgi:hypothetical protein
MMRREQVDLLDAIHILEGKFKLLCQSQYVIPFKVSSTNHQYEQHKEGDGMSSPSSFRNCPIKVDADELDLEPMVEIHKSKPQAIA